MTKSKAFSLIEMLTVMAIICLLATLTYPVVIKGIDKSKQSQCINNLKQIGQAIFIYTQDWQGNLPQAKKFTNMTDPEGIVSSLTNYINNPKVYICPSADKQFRDDYGISYVYNTEGYEIGSPVRHIGTLGQINPADIWVLICARPSGEPHAHFDYFSDVLWLDGHVNALKQEIE